MNKEILCDLLYGYVCHLMNESANDIHNENLPDVIRNYGRYTLALWCLFLEKHKDLVNVCYSEQKEILENLLSEFEKTKINDLKVLIQADHEKSM